MPTFEDEYLIVLIDAGALFARVVPPLVSVAKSLGLDRTKPNALLPIEFVLHPAVVAVTADTLDDGPLRQTRLQRHRRGSRFSCVHGRRALDAERWRLSLPRRATGAAGREFRRCVEAFVQLDDSANLLVTRE